ncbi:MAG: DUF3102 domain-containing protein [Limisphaerales bacterium]
MTRSLETITRLGVLVREIRRDYKSLQQLVERTRQNCNAVVAETILLGTKLAEAKRLVNHGNWREWLAKHCAEISENTAVRYIRLAKTSHVMDLKSCRSLRQAYLASGILAVDDAKTPAVDIAPPDRQLEGPRRQEPGNVAQPIVEATVVEPQMVVNEAPAIPAARMETPTTRVKGKVDDLLQCLKPLDARCRKKVAVHLKALVIFYHRFGKS